jgi:hypothetical protein
MLPYVIALTIIVTLLFSAVYVHFVFGLHRVSKTKHKVKVEVLHVARTPHLHELIFNKYS